MEKHLIKKVNEYMFNKKESIVLPPSNERGWVRPEGFQTQYAQVRMISGMLCNLHDLGYIIPKDELPMLYNLTEQELNETIYQPLLKAAKEAKGANVEHRVLFPGFPDSVRNLDVQTLSDIRFMSYFTNFLDTIQDRDPLGDGSITTDYVKYAVQTAIDAATSDNDAHSLSHMIGHMSNGKEFYSLSSSMIETIMEKKEMVKEKNPRVIHLVNDKSYFDMVRNMLSARTSLSPYDREIVTFTIDNFYNSQYMPDRIQFKETQALIDKYNFEKGYLHNINIKSIQDYERLLVSLSDGDVSLSSKQMIRNFTNKERIKLSTIFQLAMENNRPIMIESMANRQSLRFCNNVLKNRLHIDTIIGAANYKKIITQATEKQNIMSRYEESLSRGRYTEAAAILGNYSPTLLVQHLRDITGKMESPAGKPTVQSNQVMRTITDNIANIVGVCSRRVDIKTLLSAEKELLKEQQPYKIMMPKSPTASVVVKENKSRYVSDYAVSKLVEAMREGIKYQIQNRTTNGAVKIQKGTRIYVDPALMDCPIPTVGRSDSGKNRTVAAGTKLPVEQGNILRAALYKQNDRDQFIDFSAAFFDKNFKMVGQVSWNNLTQDVNGKRIAYHSGDTRACSGKGCTEIIDIDLKAAQRAYPEAKHVAYMAVMWESTPLSSCNQLFMTLSPTQDIGKQNGISLPPKDSFGTGGKDLPFNPADVQFKVDIAGDGTASIPMFYNIETGKAMIVNMETKHKSISQAVNVRPRHFDLPKGCEAIENYSSDIALKCFAYENMEVPTIFDLAKCYVDYSGATLVSKPGMADVIFAVDRTPVDDLRYHEEGQEIIEQVMITPFDKDVITAELIIDPKEIEEPTKDWEQIHNSDIEHDLDGIELK